MLPGKQFRMMADLLKDYLADFLYFAFFEHRTPVNDLRFWKFEILEVVFISHVNFIIHNS